MNTFIVGKETLEWQNVLVIYGPCEINTHSSKIRFLSVNKKKIWYDFARSINKYCDIDLIIFIIVLIISIFYSNLTIKYNLFFFLYNNNKDIWWLHCRNFLGTIFCSHCISSVLFSRRNNENTLCCRIAEYNCFHKNTGS